MLASYALCGFAHIPSIAIFVGGIAALAPKQTKTLAQVALRSLVAATLACLMIAAMAGVLWERIAGAEPSVTVTRESKVTVISCRVV